MPLIFQFIFSLKTPKSPVIKAFGLYQYISCGVSNDHDFDTNWRIRINAKMFD